MAESPSSESKQPDALRDVLPPNAVIKQVIVRYEARKPDGKMGKFKVKLDPTSTLGVVWDSGIYGDIKKCSPYEDDPPETEFPRPEEDPDIEVGKPGEQTGKGVPHLLAAVAPHGTCCFINGRWICW